MTVRVPDRLLAVKIDRVIIRVVADILALAGYLKPGQRKGLVANHKCLAFGSCHSVLELLQHTRIALCLCRAIDRERVLVHLLCRSVIRRFKRIRHHIDLELGVAACHDKLAKCR